MDLEERLAHDLCKNVKTIKLTENKLHGLGLRLIYARAVAKGEPFIYLAIYKNGEYEVRSGFPRRRTMELIKLSVCDYMEVNCER